MATQTFYNGCNVESPSFGLNFSVVPMYARHYPMMQPRGTETPETASRNLPKLQGAGNELENYWAPRLLNKKALRTEGFS